MQIDSPLFEGRIQSKLRYSFLKKTAKFMNTAALFWLFGGGPLFLFVARTQGFWFDGFYGISTGTIIALAILSAMFSGPVLPLKRKDIGLFLLFVLSLMTPILLSGKINIANPDAILKALALLPYVFAPGLWGLVFRKDLIKEETLYRLSLILLVVGNLFLFRYYTETALAHFRAGDVANAIGLSYAFANLWILILGWALLRKQLLLFSFASLAAPINVYLLSTRQSVVYISLVVLFLWLFWLLPFKIKERPMISLSLSKRKFRTLSLALLLLIVLFFSIRPAASALGRNVTIKNALETASARWSGFFQSGYTDEARIMLFKKAAEAWQEKPILGEFHYHDTPGSYAHHMLMDYLAQYGLLGCTVFLALLFIAFKNIVKSRKDHCLDISFAMMLMALMFVGMTVTGFTVNPIFHFLLFYWVASKRLPRAAAKTELV